MLIVETEPTSLIARLRWAFPGGMLELENAYAALRGMVRGTQKKKYREIMQALELNGANLRVAVSPEASHVFLTVLNENLEATLELVREVLTEPAFRSDDVDRLKAVLAAELKTELQDPSTQAARVFVRTAFPKTPMGLGAYGTEKSIQTLTPEALREIHQKIFSPPPCIGVVSPRSEGEITRLLKNAGLLFSSGVPKFPRPPSVSLETRRALCLESDEVETVPFYLGCPCPGDDASETPLLEAANFSFGAEFTARLMQVLRNQNGWTYGAYAALGQVIAPVRGTGIFSIHAFPSTQFAAQAISRSFELFQEWVEKGVTPEEWASSQRALSLRAAFAWEKAHDRLEWKLRHVLTGRKPFPLGEYRQWIARQTHAEVNQAIQKAFQTPVADGQLLISWVGKPELRSALPAGFAFETLDVRSGND